MNCCIKSLELSHSALWSIDNTFNGFNFAFSIATIITHCFDLGTFLKYTRIGGRTGSTPLWGVFFVTQRISEFAPVGNIGVPAQRRRFFYDPSFSEASRYPGERTNVYHHR